MGRTESRSFGLRAQWCAWLFGVHYFDRRQREEWESPTVGFVLCSEKNSAMVRITLPEECRQIHAPRYQLYLPTEEQLRDELVSERERIERARRLGRMG